MHAELFRWGFACTVLGEEQATRDNILRALRDLRDAATAQHCLVVYYAGHGGRRRVEGQAGSAWNYLVPVDHSAKAFRGVAEVELADLLHEICERTHNVTVIQDSCHSATAFRKGAGVWVEHLRSCNDVPTEAEEWNTREAKEIALGALPDELRARLEHGPKADLALDPDSNPHVVRFYATGSTSAAFEYHDDGLTSGYQGYRGYFTTHLCAVLAEVRERELRMSWDAIRHRVQERVFQHRGTMTQRPDIAGPRARIPFELEVFGDVRDHLSVARRSDGTVWVRGGRLQGLSVGDELALCGGRTQLDTARVLEVCDDTAQLRVGDPRGLQSRHVTDVLAIPTKYQLSKSIWVASPDAQGGASNEVLGRLAGYVSEALRLHRVEKREDATFAVELVSGYLVVTGPSWLRRKHQAANEEGARRLVRDLDDVARSEILMELLGSPRGLGKIVCEFQATVVDSNGIRHVLQPCDEVKVGDKLFVGVRHMVENKERIFVTALGRGVGRRIGLIQQSEPAGREAEALGEVRIGARANDPGGVPIIWPPDVPDDAPGSADLVIVVSRRALDLRALCEDPYAERRPAEHRDGKVLPRGPTRDATPMDELLGKELMWDVEHFTLEVKRG